MAESLWTPAERRAWQWPDALKPSQWAERHRILPSHVTAEPGPWRNERTPYLAGVMDAVSEPGVEEVVVIKAAQVGFSEALRNIIGFAIDHEPGPALIVMPDQKSAEELIEERIKPLLEFTPAVARHLTSRAWDVKKAAIRLDSMSLYLGWAGSSQALKSRPIRWLFLEEPDEYPASSGGGGDPISKAMKRVTTYAAKGRARVVIGGTPTTRQGNVWKAWASCGEQRHYWVPCPHCGKFQRLYWKQVRYEQARDGEGRTAHAARMLESGAAWYECEHCRETVLEANKPAMLVRGVWAGSDQAVTADGRVVGAVRRPRRVGFCLPATYSPWVSFARLASEWIEAQDDPQSLMDFINQRLAEPFEQQRAKTEPGVFENKRRGAPPARVVPGWARLLIATADTQGVDEQTGYFYYTIRAWAPGYRSQLVDHGVCQSKEELRRTCLDRPLPIGGGAVRAVPQILLVDSGGPRWSEVYQFAVSDPGRIKPTKGLNRAARWVVEQKPQKSHGIVLWEIDTEQAKDLLHRLIHDPDRGKWAINDAASDDYCRQMCAEHKIIDPRTGREAWVELVKNANHYWDCEALQCAAAWALGAMAPDPEPTRAPDPEPEPAGRYELAPWRK